MTDVQPKTIVKSLRIEPELWLRVVNRAAVKEITPSAWLIRCIKDGLKKAGDAK